MNRPGMSPSKVFERIIEPDKKDLGEFTVGRLLPSKQRQRVGPFVFFDHMGPAQFPPGKGVNVRSHPHIGLATITYLFEGEILHRDNLGFVQPIRPGAVNWMTAGKGIVHSEKVTEEILAQGQRLHGLQTWVALPLDKQEIDPRFEHYAADAIPTRRLDGAAVCIVIGSAYGAASPVRTESETLYVEVKLDAGAALDMPAAQELAVFAVSGNVQVGGEAVPQGSLAVVEKGVTAALSSDSGGHAMICGGDVLEGERIVWWNFVHSSRERIEEAKRDWKNGRFGKVPGEEDFIPLPS